MGNVAQTSIALTFEAAKLPFQLTNAVQANGTLTTGQTGVTSWVADAPGSIVGWSGGLNETIVTGTIKAHATINGSLCPVFGDTTDSWLVPEHNYAYHRQDARQPLFTFQAGDRLGMEYRTAGTLNPTTGDGSWLLTVLLENVIY